jgi:hypothetical protein
MKNLRDLQDFVKENKSLVNLTSILFLENNKKQEIAIAYDTLLNYLQFETYLKEENSKLLGILLANNSLEQPLLKRWVNNNVEFFENNIFNFGIDYLDKNDVFRIPVLEERIDTSNFSEIILFWKCMWLLYFGEYHKETYDRKPNDEIGSYYYSAPDALSDIEKLKNYLNIS